MSTQRKGGDQPIDCFVAVLNDRGMQPLPAEEVPEDLRNNALQDSDWVEWTIRAVAPSFRDFVERVIAGEIDIQA